MKLKSIGHGQGKMTYFVAVNHIILNEDWNSFDNIGDARKQLETMTKNLIDLYSIVGIATIRDEFLMERK